MIITPTKKNRRMHAKFVLDAETKEHRAVFPAFGIEAFPIKFSLSGKAGIMVTLDLDDDGDGEALSGYMLSYDEARTLGQALINMANEAETEQSA